MIAARSGTRCTWRSKMTGSVSSGSRIADSSTDGGQCFFQIFSMLPSRPCRQSNRGAPRVADPAGRLYAKETAMRNKQVLLANRPKGDVQESDFRIVESDLPAPRDGQVLVRVLYLSL